MRQTWICFVLEKDLRLDGNYATRFIIYYKSTSYLDFNVYLHEHGTTLVLLFTIFFDVNLILSNCSSFIINTENDVVLHRLWLTKWIETGKLYSFCLIRFDTVFENNFFVCSKKI